ncbi:hypothetical protein JW887_00850 [Candidatus Dojkabacteria bacterium]|nr:hypothetical protein [Candidatus Dojkabacteria bacterium]
MKKRNLNKLALLILDFDPEHHGRHLNEAMTYFIDEVYPLLGQDAKCVVNICGLALLHYKRYGNRNDGFKKFKKMILEGKIIIGNHSFMHYDFTGGFLQREETPLSEILVELCRLDELCGEEFLMYPNCYRAPYFNINEDTRQLLRDRFRFDFNGYIKISSVYEEDKVIEKGDRNYRINTNIVLDSQSWQEDIATPSQVDLERIGRYVVSAHPYEFHSSCNSYKETNENLKLLLNERIVFVSPEDFIVN